MRSPPPKTGEAQPRAPRRRSAAAPRRGRAPRRRRHLAPPSWAADVATSRCAARRNQASTRCSSHQAPMASTEAWAASAARPPRRDRPGPGRSAPVPQPLTEAAVAPRRARPAGGRLEHDHARAGSASGRATRSTGRGSRRRRRRRRPSSSRGARRRRRRAGLGYPPAVRVVDHQKPDAASTAARSMSRSPSGTSQPTGSPCDARRACRPAPRGSPGWRPGGGAASSRPRGRRSRRPPQHSSASATARSVHSRKPATVTAIRPAGRWPPRPGPRRSAAGRARRPDSRQDHRSNAARTRRRRCRRAAGR